MSDVVWVLRVSDEGVGLKWNTVEVIIDPSRTDRTVGNSLMVFSANCSFLASDLSDSLASLFKKRE